MFYPREIILATPRFEDMYHWNVLAFPFLMRVGWMAFILSILIGLLILSPTKSLCALLEETTQWRGPRPVRQHGKNSTWKNKSRHQILQSVSEWTTRPEIAKKPSKSRADVISSEETDARNGLRNVMRADTHGHHRICPVVTLRHLRWRPRVISTRTWPGETTGDRPRCRRGVSCQILFSASATNA